MRTICYILSAVSYVLQQLNIESVRCGRCVVSFRRWRSRGLLYPALQGDCDTMYTLHVQPHRVGCILSLRVLATQLSAL